MPTPKGHPAARMLIPKGCPSPRTPTLRDAHAQGCPPRGMPTLKDADPKGHPLQCPLLSHARCWGRGQVPPYHLLTVYSAGTPWHSSTVGWHRRVASQGREGVVRPGSGHGRALPAAHRCHHQKGAGCPVVPGGARPQPCPGLTSDGVGVVVPGLLRDVEDAGGHRPCPARQFAAGGPQRRGGLRSGQNTAGGHSPAQCHPALLH